MYILFAPGDVTCSHLDENVIIIDKIYFFLSLSYCAPPVEILYQIECNIIHKY